MVKDTRKEILQSAKRLFNKHGYNNVSTRDIADSLGISKGNLTYYFQKKEEIIEAIIDENTSIRLRPEPKTLQDLDAFFVDIQTTVQENAFYFWHHAQLAQISSKVRQLQAEVFKENTWMLRDAFHTLNENALIRKEEYEGEYGKTIDTLLLTSVYWLPFCELKEESRHEGFLQQAWSIVYPLLTQKGKDELKNMKDTSE